MTKEQALQNADAIRAHEAGKPVQFCFCLGEEGDWKDCGPTPLWEFNSTIYRPKPEPKARPWSKPDDVPGPVCWIRHHSSGKEDQWMVIGMCADGVKIAGAYGDWLEKPSTESWSRLREFYYSTDRKTWHPCTVTE